MARKSARLTKKLRSEFVEVLVKNRGHISKTCQQLGIESRQTYYNWMEKYPEFKRAVEEAQEAKADWVESKLDTNIMNGNQRAIEYWLNAHAKHRGYTNSSEISMDVRAAVSDIFPNEDELGGYGEES